ncbi:restriction endonuclease [Leptospira bandrabouensis]|uniref:restriction endonuclease n=1 Tax=Leptospira bandrabouensis TaxID=2484903 RepID=UPI001EE9AAB5|nr:restriction endonuclease [Leptospira bandrabouensis]MCG6144150.1 restriction endonuclease [Leptospira bandrabouensis]MCG6159811.1 restriction endonuclease [Leptospira bandrabouensis]MCG6163744.1 restriction endonuclease [Leptospira bandrabouensis]
MKIPTYDEMMNPLISALKELGGSGTIEEINERVFAIMELSNDVLEIPHGEKGSRSEVEYRLAWTRTYLKRAGMLENSSRGVWSLTSESKNANRLNPKDIVSHVRSLTKVERKEKEEMEDFETNDLDAPEEFRNWRNDLKDILFAIKPDAFERLFKRILRESGFHQVEVTGKSGDGGIDGKGIFRIAGFISFNVLFQCKRYRNNSVSASEIRDFRGALQGRADKGLFVTTSSFTREAIKEATRDGAPPIDLIDGDALIDKLKELQLGLEIEIVEKVEINKDWFNDL